MDILQCRYNMVLTCKWGEKKVLTLSHCYHIVRSHRQYHDSWILTADSLIHFKLKTVGGERGNGF